jgi:hypothetical protein
VAKEFDMKIKEVHEHYQNMMRSHDEEVKKLSLTLEEMERKLSESKFDAFAKGDFVDKLAPQGIYGKDSTTKASPKVEKTAYGPEASEDTPPPHPPPPVVCLLTVA